MAIDNVVETSKFAVRVASEKIPPPTGPRNPEQQRIARVREAIGIKPRNAGGQEYLEWVKNQGELGEGMGDEKLKKVFDRHIRSSDNDRDDATGLKRRTAPEEAILNRAVTNCQNVRELIANSEFDGLNPWFDALTDDQKDFFRLPVAQAILSQQLAPDVYGITTALPTGNSGAEKLIRQGIYATLGEHIDALIKDPRIIERIRLTARVQLTEFNNKPEINVALFQKEYDGARDARIKAENARDDAAGKLKDFEKQDPTKGILDDGEKTKKIKDVSQKMKDLKDDPLYQAEEAELTKKIAQRDILGKGHRTDRIDDKISDLAWEIATLQTSGKLAEYAILDKQKVDLEAEERELRQQQSNAEQTLNGGPDISGSRSRESAIKTAVEEAQKGEKEAMDLGSTIIRLGVKAELDERRDASIQHIQGETQAETQKRTKHGKETFDNGIEKRWKRERLIDGKERVDVGRALDDWKDIKKEIGNIGKPPPATPMTEEGVKKLIVGKVLESVRNKVGDEEIRLTPTEIAGFLADTDFVNKYAPEGVTALLKIFRESKTIIRDHRTVGKEDHDALERVFGKEATEKILEHSKLEEEGGEADEHGHGGGSAVKKKTWKDKVRRAVGLELKYGPLGLGWVTIPWEGLKRVKFIKDHPVASLNIAAALMIVTNIGPLPIVGAGIFVTEALIAGAKKLKPKHHGGEHHP